MFDNPYVVALGIIFVVVIIVRTATYKSDDQRIDEALAEFDEDEGEGTTVSG